ncbi:MAG: ABC transporter permease [Puniceicoccales bacterium]|jgi:lipoprotein-releasing system permease protein|nr:ABC transporter permease [Puniceicoccales bacterium]
MNWSIYLAYKSLFPSQRRFTSFTAMSIIGVMLGVAVLVVVQSVMNGLQTDIKHNMVQIQGEIRIEEKNIIEHPRDIEEKLRTTPGIDSYAPYTYGVIMMMHGDTPIFPVVKGIDRERESQVTGIEGMLQLCSLNDLDDDCVIIGEQLASRSGIQIGDNVEIYTPLALEALQKDEIIFPRDIRIAGYFSANHYDQNAILCSLSLMQDLYAMGEGVHGFTLKLQEGQPLEKIAQQLQNILGEEYRVTDWVHGNSELLFALRWEKTMMFFVLLFILLVASFSISSTLITNVIRKRREIGLIVAIGGSRYGVARCFSLQGFFIGICGTLLGILVGVTVLYYRDYVIRFVRWALNWEGAQNYLVQFVHLPVEYNVNDFLIISLFSILICIISGIIPGYKAAQVNPAEALRYEQ